MIKRVLKRLIMSISSIYLINIFLNVVNIFIPFNIISIAVTYILGIPGIVALILLSIII